MLADLPPSSRNSFFTCWAAVSMMRRPTAVEPVKEIMSTPGWATIASLTSAEVVVSTLRTPGGMSVSSAAILPTKQADHGVNGDGLSTTVLPAASAGPTLAHSCWIG